MEETKKRGRRRTTSVRLNQFEREWLDALAAAWRMRSRSATIRTLLQLALPDARGDERQPIGGGAP